MKKFLSLVLALVMTMSLVTISAGAKDFTDSDKVTYDDAIEVMSELKVIDGYTDGSFRPTVELNRGAAAKIICNMILGPTTASALSASSAPFVDVPADSVFAGYITYCAKEGIINGYADGTFRPTAPLTGYAFMKMLLGALGYDADIEGYTGANWSVNVAKQAIGIGLDDGNDNFVGTKYVTREEACLYALNTLKATMVRYSQKTTVSVNGATVVVGGSEAYEETHVNGKASKDDKFNNDGKVQFAEKYFKDLTTTPSFDDFGRPADDWKIKNKKVGTYADNADATYTEKVKGKTVYADLGSDSKDAKLTWYVDGKSADVKKFAIAKNNDEKIGGQGALTEAFFDSDAETVRIVTVNTYIMQVDGDYDEDAEELTLAAVDTSDANVTPDAPELKSKGNILSADEIDGLDAFEDEDYVLVTVADGEIKSIVKAEKVTGAVTEYVVEDSVVLGGTEYKYAAKSGDAEDMTYKIDDEYTAYLDTYGNIIFVDGAEDDNEYVYISEFSTSSQLSVNSKVIAYAYFADGTEDEIVVSKMDGDKVKGNKVDGEGLASSCAGKDAGKWYKFDAKNDSYELFSVKDQKGSVAETVVVDSEKTVVIGGVGLRGTKDTVFVVVDKNDDVKVYTGIKNAPKLTTSGTDAKIQATFDGKYAEYVFIDLGDDGVSKGGAASSDYILVLDFDKEGKDSGDNKYYRYKAVLNGEETKVKFEKEYAENVLYTEVEYDSETGYVTDMAAVTDPFGTDDADYTVKAYTAAKVSQKAGVVTIYDQANESDADKYYMADGAVITMVKYDGVDYDELETISAKNLAKTYAVDGNTTMTKTVYGVLNADGEYTALYIVATPAPVVEE